jgi:hypothetical protein
VQWVWRTANRANVAAAAEKANKAVRVCCCCEHVAFDADPSKGQCDREAAAAEAYMHACIPQTALLRSFSEALAFFRPRPKLPLPAAFVCNTLRDAVKRGGKHAKSAKL